MNHLLTLKDYTSAEIKDIIRLALNLKADSKKFSQKLVGKTLALIFQKTSTRTRMSFESGMIQLGGHAIFLDWRVSNFTLGMIEDEIKCMERYVDVIMARVFEHSDLELMAKSVSRVPIINGLSDDFHPCQTLADLMLITERFQEPEKITISYVGDGSNNVAASLAIGCAKLGINLNIGAPDKYQLRKDVNDYLKNKDLEKFIHLYRNPFDAEKNASAIYTDTWVSMGQEAEKAKRLKIFEEYQVNKQLVGMSKFNPIIMHCLPAHRELEITSEVLDSDNSLVFDQAENRLHVQKAILLKLLCPEYAGVQNRLF